MIAALRRDARRHVPRPRRVRRQRRHRALGRAARPDALVTDLLAGVLRRARAPALLIVSHSVFQGPYKGHGVQNAQAIKMVLAERGWRAGPYAVGMQACEEADAKTGVPSPAKCARNARAFARNRSVVGVIGPLTSNCAVHMLATLNEAPDGPLAMIAGGNTYVGLTRSGPGTNAGEPERYHPTGRRSYARLAPTDDVQGAAAALHARRHGAERVFVVEDGGPYGRGLAATFQHAAGELGMTLAGSARWKVDERRLPPARRARPGRPPGRRARRRRHRARRPAADLRPREGPRPRGAADGRRRLQPAGGDRRGGGCARRRTGHHDRRPAQSQPPRSGPGFAAEFVRRFSQRPCCFSVHEAQATNMMLDAIAGSGGSRARVTEAVMSARVEGGLIGDFAIDAQRRHHAERDGDLPHPRRPAAIRGGRHAARGSARP